MWMRPLRAKRIDDLLAERRTFDERDFLAMQLDTRAEGYEQIRDTILDVVADDEREPKLQRARELAEPWNGSADVDQTGVSHAAGVLPRAARAHARAAARARRSRRIRASSTAGRSPTRCCGGCSTSGPRICLTSEHADWRSFLRQTLLETLAEIERGGALDAEWGEINVLDVAHPFAGSLGPLARLLRCRAAPLPGSMVSLRVAAPSYGAVLRMAVAPGAPENGVLELAGGQSGHFLSPQFRDQQARLGRRHADAVSRRRARRALRAEAVAYWKTPRSIVGGSASAKCGCTAQISSPTMAAVVAWPFKHARRRRAAPTSSCRCSRTRRAAARFRCCSSRRAGRRRSARCRPARRRAR